MFALAPDCHAEGRYTRLWRRHFYDGIAAAVPEMLRPEGIDFTWARPASDASLAPARARPAASERLWAQIRDAPALDAVISYCFATDVDPSLVERTRALGVPWINFFCDSTYAFDRVEPLARVTSLNWFPEHAALGRYRALGRPALCRPYAVHPGALPEAGCEIAAHALGFVGAPTGNRVTILAALRLLGCRPAVRGEGWRRAPAPAPGRRPRPASTGRRARGSLRERLLTRALWPLLGVDGGTLSDEELPRFLSRCRVVLGLNEGRDERGVYTSYLKLRDIEMPGYGCCYLTQHNEDVARAFEVGREVLTFRSLLEAAAHARRAAREPAAARAMGLAARRRVLAEHGWASRLPELARAL